MNHWYLYILFCDKKIYYVGITNNLVHRFNQHLSNESFYTKQFSDLKFVYAEKYEDKHSAALREKQIKGWSQKKKRMLLSGELGINACTEFVELLLAGENLVSLLRAYRRA